MASSSHLDATGRLRMVEVGGKQETARRAVAECEVRMQPETLRAIEESALPKGDVLAVAQVAGVMAAKRTPELIPGCHPVRITGIDVAFEVRPPQMLGVRAEVRGVERTGFEMEALVAATTAALTVYDMCKGIDPAMQIGDVRVTEKEGGKSGLVTDGEPKATELPLSGVSACVLTVSTLGARGERVDTSGDAIEEWLTSRGARVVGRRIVADGRDVVAGTLREILAEQSPHLLLTTGGTGMSPSDLTPEATLEVADRQVPGLAEVMRGESLRVTPHGMISRAVAATAGSTLIVNLPGSPKAVIENLAAIAPALSHAIELLQGGRPH